MNTRTTDEFRDDLARFDTCMLATKDGSRLRSRPMKPYLDNPDGTIRFLTSTKTHKVNEVEANPDANAIFVDEDGTWISVSGKVRVSSDAGDIDELWSPDAAPWFVDGKAEAVVMIMTPDMAEYWDSGSKLKAGWELAKSAVTGKKPDIGEHGKIAL
jgi:general stress protein 26